MNFQFITLFDSVVPNVIANHELDCMLPAVGLSLSLTDLIALSRLT